MSGYKSRKAWELGYSSQQTCVNFKVVWILESVKQTSHAATACYMQQHPPSPPCCVKGTVLNRVVYTYFTDHDLSVYPIIAQLISDALRSVSVRFTCSEKLLECDSGFSSSCHAMIVISIRVLREFINSLTVWTVVMFLILYIVNDNYLVDRSCGGILLPCLCRLSTSNHMDCTRYTTTYPDHLGKC